MPGANAKRCPCCGQRSNLRKAECPICLTYVYASRAQFTGGYHQCRCGQGELRPVCLVDVAMTAADAGEARDAYAEYEHRFGMAPCPTRGISGNRLHCGGCHEFIPATNHDCGCGFANDIRSGRNVGRWVSGASSCKERRAEGIPF